MGRLIEQLRLTSFQGRDWVVQADHLISVSIRIANLKPNDFKNGSGCLCPLIGIALGHKAGKTPRFGIPVFH